MKFAVRAADTCDMVSYIYLITIETQQEYFVVQLTCCHLDYPEGHSFQSPLEGDKLREKSYSARTRISHIRSK